GFEPGATFVVRASLTEFGIPLAGMGTVDAELRWPDGTRSVIALVKVGPGIFETRLAASLAGVYQFHVTASGWTHRGEAFTREELLTGATVIGGDATPPTTPPTDRGHESICRLLTCLLSNESIGPFLAQQGIDAAVLRRCVRQYCAARDAP